MKDGYAVVYDEKPENKDSLWLSPNVKGNGLPLIACVLLWMSCFLFLACLSVACVDP